MWPNRKDAMRIASIDTQKNKYEGIQMKDIVMQNMTIGSQDVVILQENTNNMLQQCEEAIQRGLNGFLVAGVALARIKQEKLYKDRYRSYEEYCKKRWNITPQHDNRLIKAARVVEEIKTEPTGSVSVPPQSENQARALARSDNPAADWKRAQEITGKEQPSAKEIEKVVRGDGNSTQEVIDVEIDETKDATVFEMRLCSKLDKILITPYSMGVRTDRAQVCVEADDETTQRLTGLKERLKVPKHDIVARALLYMEQSLDAIDEHDHQEE